MTEWEVCSPNSHRSLAVAEAVATWLNSHHGGRGRFRYRGAIQPDGSYRVERTTNPNAAILETVPERGT
jgi:hypothetical protein